MIVRNDERAEPDGGTFTPPRFELYDITADMGETTNLAAENAAIVAELTQSLVRWHQSMPPDNGADFAKGRK